MRNLREEFDEDENPDDGEDSEDLSDGYLPCPYCGETMLEAADHCPGCNRWMTSEDLPARRRSKWWMVMIVILLALMILTIIPF